MSLRQQVRIGDGPKIRPASRMPRSSASSFGEPADLRAALSADGFACLVAFSEGPFRARLIQVALNIVCLTMCREEQPFCAFLRVPDDAVLIALPIGHGPWPVWSGMSMRPGELMTFGPRQRLHGALARRGASAQRDK